jgi:hypothetical protein
MVDMGIMAGPAKATLLWAQSSGPVLNNNNPAYRSPFVLSGFNPKTYTGWALDYQALEPYQYLMFGVYAGGNQTFSGLFVSDDGRGLMSDAYAFAGRLDYAVASNLNVYGTYMWAHRLESYGTFMGHFMSNGVPATAAQRAAFRQNAGVPLDGFERYVPDGFLGWEVNLGLDWKLLEGLTLRTKYAYWAPGQWFNYAYQAVMPGQVFVAPGDALPAGASPGTRNGQLGVRDAIQAFEGSLTIDF